VKVGCSTVTKRKPLVWIDAGDDRIIPDCMKCMDALTPMLMEACASVGIEHNRSTDDMARQYLAEYHARNHEDMR
jgi:hypothetical protein